MLNGVGSARLKSLGKWLGLFAIALLSAAIVGDADARTKSKKAKVEAPQILPVAQHSPPRFFTINQVLAKRADHQHLAQVQVAALDRPQLSDSNTDLIAPLRSDEPFGLFVFRAPEGLLWQKWREVQVAIRSELDELAICRFDAETCSDAARRFHAVVAAARAQTGRARYETVNRLINDAILYTSDGMQHGVIDRWTAPLAALAARRGDCEDYAIAKLVALREAGVPSNDMRLLLVRDRAIFQDHAVLAVRHDGRWLILDNRFSVLPDAGEMRSFVPRFALNDEGVQMYVAPYAKRPQETGHLAAPAAPADIFQADLIQADLIQTDLNAADLGHAEAGDAERSHKAALPADMPAAPGGLTLPPVL